MVRRNRNISSLLDLGATSVRRIESELDSKCGSGLSSPDFRNTGTIGQGPTPVYRKQEQGRKKSRQVAPQPD